MKESVLTVLSFNVILSLMLFYLERYGLAYTLLMVGIIAIVELIYTKLNK